MIKKQYSCVELSEIFGLSERQVQLLSSSGVIPKTVKGSYSTDSIIDYINHLKTERDLKNAEGIAEFFNVTTAAIYKYQKQGMPRIKRGKYSSKDCANWLVKKWRDKAEGADRSDINDERKELVHHQKRKAKIEADKLERTSIPGDEVFADMTTIAGIVVEELSSFAGRISDAAAVEADPAVVRQMVNTETKYTRRKIAELVKKYEKTLPDDIPTDN